MANLDQIMDYLADNSIVEQGTDGDWTYRKWGNGTAECWLRKSYSVSITAVASYYHRGAVNNISFPTGLFVSVPAILVTPTNSTYWVGANGITENLITNVYVYDVVNGNTTVWLTIYAIGKWK